MSSNTSGEGEIRRRIVEADLVDCMVALPGQLFYSTQIPACLWFLARKKAGGGPAASDGVGPQQAASGGAGAPHTVTDRAGARHALPAAGHAAHPRVRRRQTLFIDARRLGRMLDRTHRELTDDEVARIAATYQAWRGDADAGEYRDIPGFCKSATTEEIAASGFVLTPGRYVGAEAIEGDGEPFEEKMQRLVATLEEQFAESARLEVEIREYARILGYGA